MIEQSLENKIFRSVWKHFKKNSMQPQNAKEKKKQAGAELGKAQPQSG